MRKKIFAGALGLAVLMGLPAEAAGPAGNAVAVQAGEEAGAVALPQPGAQGSTATGGLPTADAGVTPAAVEQGTALPADRGTPPEQAAATEPQTAQPVAAAQQQQGEPQPLKIVINLASRSLAVYEGDRKIRLYPVGVGTTSTPTPVGYYKIRTKDVNPSWTDPSDPSYTVPSGPSNPLGYRWMEIKGHYGIHGTNKPNSIGHYVSNGCIRLQEKDVEALFDMVEIGTPVEITYNRVVVEKTPENIVVYYIYPDGYYRQKLDVASVNQWLEGYGVSAFESDEDIAKKIEASDGEPTYIGAIYGIDINGKRIRANAVARDNVIYLPAIPIAENTSTDLRWDADRSMLVSPYGEVPGLDKKGQLYLKAADARTLFLMAGTLQANNVFTLQSIKKKPTAKPAPVPRAAERPATGSDPAAQGQVTQPAQPSQDAMPVEPSQPIRAAQSDQIDRDVQTEPSGQSFPADQSDQHDGDIEMGQSDQSGQSDQTSQSPRPVFDRADGSSSSTKVISTERPVISQSRREV